ncbi:hypothetical protein GOBAR_AA18586 [Gossypium barbadense]|uniref:hydroxymethylglutaryl-CoA reductase (NADPH) n=1 Tax=Gossypium barbadense TaxID=3634 RepID=A0A2P5XFF6_GOSBA|nr:hypothetical protein GOBAR_AA18586 [Gossypium barbadense]
MDVRRRPSKALRPAPKEPSSVPKPTGAKASDALPLPFYFTNALFFTLFFSVAYYLLGTRSVTPFPFTSSLSPNWQLFFPSSEQSLHTRWKSKSEIPRERFEFEEALHRITRRSLQGLPLDGFGYGSILKQCCEMPIGYVQIPLGIAGPLLLDGFEYIVPTATTEGCIVASTNRGFKGIYASGGATSTILRDGMTRAPVVRFPSASRACHLKFFLDNPSNFQTLADEFNKSSNFARLQGVQCSISGKNLYTRFSCTTGGVENVLAYLQNKYSDMDIISISRNFCFDKKLADINWIEGRGKLLNMLKNLADSVVASALGGFNAHASNIVSAIFIATGQDPAQNVESSHYITIMEAVNDEKDLHISMTMPSIEVGTIGGGTQLASQSACLDLLGVKGATKELPGANLRLLAKIVAGSVLAGELSLMAAIASGQLVQSHMKYNRSTKDVSKVGS